MDKASVTMALTGIYGCLPGPTETRVGRCGVQGSVLHRQSACVRSHCYTGLYQAPRWVWENKEQDTTLWHTGLGSHTHGSKWLTTHDIRRSRIRHRQNILEKEELCFTLPSKAGESFFYRAHLTQVLRDVGDPQMGKLSLKDRILAYREACLWRHRDEEQIVCQG